MRCSREPENSIHIAMVGKYVGIGDFQLTDSYISVNQSLVHAGVAWDTKVEITWIDGHQFDNGETKLSELDRFDGLIVPGAFGSGGSEGVIQAIKYARDNNVPFLGLCYGLPIAMRRR